MRGARRAEGRRHVNEFFSCLSAPGAMTAPQACAHAGGGGHRSRAITGGTAAVAGGGDHRRPGFLFRLRRPAVPGSAGGLITACQIPGGSAGARRRNRSSTSAAGKCSPTAGRAASIRHSRRLHGALTPDPDSQDGTAGQWAPRLGRIVATARHLQPNSGSRPCCCLQWACAACTRSLMASQ